MFEAMGTQWRTGPGGVLGLDYAALPAVMGFKGVKRAEREQVFDDVRVMEDAAVLFFQQQAERNSKR